jgi:hypothetical protein
LIAPPAGIEKPDDADVTGPVWQSTLIPAGRFHPPVGDSTTGVVRAPAPTVIVKDWDVLLSVVAVMVALPAFSAVTLPLSPPSTPQSLIVTARTVGSELFHVVSRPIHVTPFPSVSLARSVTLAPTASVLTCG